MSNYEFWDELGKIFNAVVAYQEKSIEFNKRFINPWIRLGNVFDKQDRHREAVSAYQKAVEIDPGNAQNWCDLGNAYFRTEAYDQAIHAFKQAIELDPQFGWPYSNLALIHTTRGEHEQAILLYKTSIDLLQDHKDRAVSWNRLGNLYRKLNEYDLAVQAFQKADELDHENAGFRDELDDVPEKVTTSLSAVEADSAPSLNEIGSPIQLIVEENQAEEAALTAFSGELAAAPLVDDGLAQEGGDELPEADLEIVPASADTAQAELLDPVQSPEQMGRLPEELNLEPEAGPLAMESSEVLQESDARAAGQITAEPVAETGTETIGTPAGEAAKSLVESEPEASGIPHGVVETVTESLILADTATDTTEMSVAAGESETSAAPEADAVEVEAGAQTPALAQEAPTDAVQPVATSLEIAAEANSEPNAAVEVEPEAVSEPVERMEPAPVPAPEPVEIAEATPVIAAEVPEAVKVASEPAVQAIETETVPEPAAIPEAGQLVQELAAEEPAALKTPTEDTAGTVPVTVEAVPALPVAEKKAEDETEVLQHAAYEEFLKDDGKVLNTMTVTHAEEALPVSAEPITRIDESGEFQIAMDTKNAHVWNELGNVYFNNGAIDDSIVAYSKAIELDRWFAWPYSNLAQAYVQKERFAEAVLLYQRSIELFQSEKDKAVSWNRLGNVYRRMNDYDRAIAAYQRADDLDPDNTALSLQSRFSLLGNFQMEQNASLLA